jgi:hypothetical protein
MGFGEVRARLERAIKTRQGRIHLAALKVNRPKQIQRVGVARLRRDDLFVETGRSASCPARCKASALRITASFMGLPYRQPRRSRAAHHPGAASTWSNTRFRDCG